GLLFIVVVGFFPAGLAGLGVLLSRWRRNRASGPSAEQSQPQTASDTDTEKVGATS
ncbi:urea ABC transporter permease subunit UrtC, partial [Mycolicibacterium porcinum]